MRCRFTQLRLLLALATGALLATVKGLVPADPIPVRAEEPPSFLAESEGVENACQHHLYTESPKYKCAGPYDVTQAHFPSSTTQTTQERKLVICPGSLIWCAGNTQQEVEHITCDTDRNLIVDTPTTRLQGAPEASQHTPTSVGYRYKTTQEGAQYKIIRKKKSMTDENWTELVMNLRKAACTDARICLSLWTLGTLSSNTLDMQLDPRVRGYESNAFNQVAFVKDLEANQASGGVPDLNWAQGLDEDDPSPMCTAITQSKEARTWMLHSMWAPESGEKSEETRVLDKQAEIRYKRPLKHEAPLDFVNFAYERCQDVKKMLEKHVQLPPGHTHDDAQNLCYSTKFMELFNNNLAYKHCTSDMCGGELDKASCNIAHEDPEDPNLKCCAWSATARQCQAVRGCPKKPKKAPPAPVKVQQRDGDEVVRILVYGDAGVKEANDVAKAAFRACIAKDPQLGPKQGSVSKEELESALNTENDISTLTNYRAAAKRGCHFSISNGDNMYKDGPEPTAKDVNGEFSKPGAPDKVGSDKKFQSLFENYWGIFGDDFDFFQSLGNHDYGTRGGSDKQGHHIYHAVAEQEVLYGQTCNARFRMEGRHYQVPGLPDWLMIYAMDTNYFDDPDVQPTAEDVQQVKQEYPPLEKKKSFGRTTTETNEDYEKRTRAIATFRKSFAHQKGQIVTAGQNKVHKWVFGHHPFYDHLEKRGNPNGVVEDKMAVTYAFNGNHGEVAKLKPKEYTKMGAELIRDAKLTLTSGGHEHHMEHSSTKVLVPGQSAHHAETLLVGNAGKSPPGKIPLGFGQHLRGTLDQPVSTKLGKDEDDDDVISENILRGGTDIKHGFSIVEVTDRGQMFIWHYQLNDGKDPVRMENHGTLTTIGRPQVVNGDDAPHWTSGDLTVETVKTGDVSVTVRVQYNGPNGGMKVRCVGFEAAPAHIPAPSQIYDGQGHDGNSAPYVSSQVDELQRSGSNTYHASLTGTGTPPDSSWTSLHIYCANRLQRSKVLVVNKPPSPLVVEHVSNDDWNGDMAKLDDDWAELPGRQRQRGYAIRDPRFVETESIIVSKSKNGPPPLERLKRKITRTPPPGLRDTMLARFKHHQQGDLSPFAD